MQVRQFAIGVLLGLGLVACGEDAPVQSSADATGTSAGEDVQVAVNPVVPVFLPVGGTATTGAVSIDGSWVDDHIRVEVAVNHFADLFGIAGHLHYDPAVLQITSSQANAVPLGDKKDTSDYKPRGTAKESPTGRILLGGARFSNVPSPFDTPSGVKLTRETWLVLEFHVLQKVKTVIAFDPNSLVARNGSYTEVPTDWGQLTIDWPSQGGAP